MQWTCTCIFQIFHDSSRAQHKTVFGLRSIGNNGDLTLQQDSKNGNMVVSCTFSHHLAAPRTDCDVPPSTAWPWKWRRRSTNAMCLGEAKAKGSVRTKKTSRDRWHNIAQVCFHIFFPFQKHYSFFGCSPVSLCFCWFLFNWLRTQVCEADIEVSTKLMYCERPLVSGTGMNNLPT